ncbi:hypothetical protein C6Y40_01415 [Alteromonas alba]|jgi:hypothetical protein|uniref:Peptidase n=1 Tax=Alteromonas alba TaxID=2079529 RepID=A0A2S9VFX0_9ALTE|nr:PepSY-associated TM helix domain-containing protein [Alteromonas alba]HCA76827.1 hypothetical protein [Alteromonas sp.]PRO75371.1 hypothetical protein C6Y40_01415 [Alteromonas alba]HCB09726.1 hypothetical protein [Alteromonas sp.]HCL12193.1 hypothetical protein [Alteromonas sp.]HCV18534.1 hypothetical protein [Alteromonas sp.]|tara:strand:- start:6986 stop:7585 length:600 start_codon:yes stop_codon:yes gene_type:complete
MRFSLGTARQWHWISAAVSLVGMLLFAVTGITLNHAAVIPASISVTTVESEVPADVLTHLQDLPMAEMPAPQPVRQWLASEHSISVPPDVAGEFDGMEFYLAWPGPGADRWLAINVDDAALLYEGTERGWIAYFNDLHKGRNTGPVWFVFIDVIAIAMIVFTLTGLWLLVKQASHKQSTWPVTALGLLIPVVIALVFIH